MSLATVYTRSSTGINAPLVTVEVHLANGLPSLSIVGLPEAAVKESKDRVRSAIINCNFDFPAKRITINLAPADLPKEGGRFDLPIALGILAASGQIPTSKLQQLEFIGELSLSGELRMIKGALPAALAAHAAARALCLPHQNLAEAELISNAKIISAQHLLEVCAHLNGQQSIPLPSKLTINTPSKSALDFKDVTGQHHAKRALEIAAAGKHSLIMIGPPGTGKSMLASRLASILPPLEEQQALETASIQSISNQEFNAANWRKPPFRAPHHTASAVALVGGGSQPKPGEVSLAHNGVLFLDELPEYERKVLEVLREPLENGFISISRAAHQTEFPALFQLLAAMNPCPCGYLGDNNGRCQCNADQVLRYRNKISGPLIDRIDMHIEVPRIKQADLRQRKNNTEESSATISKRVLSAQKLALSRQGHPNHLLNTAEITTHCQLADDDYQLLELAIEKLGLSHRAYHRILRVSRTIADMAGNNNIQREHISEALSYRRLDRKIN